MSNAKKYEINTVQDMIDCTNEQNIDNFLKDLRGVILGAHALRKITEVVNKDYGLNEEDIKPKTKGFIWIDDGEHNINITIKPEENE